MPEAARFHPFRMSGFHQQHHSGYRTRKVMGDTMRTQKTNSKKKTAAIATAGVLGLATAGGAYAYWSSNGGGTGSASTASGSENVFLVTGGVAEAM